MRCNKCKGLAVKNGKQSNGRQRYFCKNCRISFQRSYFYQSYNCDTNKKIYRLLKEGVSVMGISRLIKISKTTVIKRIKFMASLIVRPLLEQKHQYYELDEMRVVVGCKSTEAWITYAINRYTKKVVEFIVGRRTKRNLSVITKSVLQKYPKMLFTDQLPAYKKLIPKELHNTRKKNTTVIERNNLTLRTRLKRLTRKTICFSKTFEMLEATLKIFFWGTEELFSKTSIKTF